MGSENKVIRCRAAVAWEPGKPLCVEEVEVAPPKAQEVRLKVEASGVCHTDWAYLYECGKGMKPRPFPLVLGHEGAGVVESVGPGVTAVRPGDKVIPLFLPQCGECECCLNPKTNLCQKNWQNTQQGVLADGTSRITCRGQQVHQFIGVSTFSEYTVVPEQNVTRINPDAPLDRVCLLGCGVATGYGAALNTGKVEAGSTCAVFGLGAVGLATVMGCKSAGATRIIAVDINPEKFQMAKTFGATESVNPTEQSRPIQEVLAEMTGGGVDYSFECVGNTDVMVGVVELTSSEPGISAFISFTHTEPCTSDFWRAALESCKAAWGTCVIVGWTELGELSLSPIDLLLGRTLKGTYFGGWKSVEGVPTLVEEYMRGRLRLDEFVTHTVGLEQVNQAFDLMTSGKSIRTVIKM